MLPGSRKPQGNRPQKGQGTKAPTGAIYVYYIYTYIYIEIYPFAILCEKIAFGLKTRFGQYLLFALGFGAPFAYNSIFGVWISIFFPTLKTLPLNLDF